MDNRIVVAIGKRYEYHHILGGGVSEEDEKTLAQTV